MSSSSYATLSALTVLENPRKVSPRTTVFTCHIFVGAPDVEKIQGSVRYYSEEDGEYPDVGVYHATIAIAQMGKGVNVFTEDAKEQAEFSFVGDIKDFFLIGELGSPGVANIDLACRAQVKVCGAVTHSDSNAATFTLDVEQYTTAFAEQQKLAATDPAVVVQKSVLHVLGFIPDSPRYKSKKPVPWTKRYVSFGGYLTGISASLEGETLQERFRVEVNHIAFLGTFTPLASTPAGSASTAGSSAGSSGSRKKAHFSYNIKSTTKRSREDDGPDGGAPSSPSPFGGASTLTLTSTAA
ncbi:hypothetical protein B0H14DRAFT_3602853 [Mycena olivaceomarginata]|nr:hypothetical protein B0H14DRAFT_3602853 [Mycena olivaceomarginata]